MSASRLLDPALVRKLDRLRLDPRHAFPGTTKGERRSTRRGSSVEFADFRDYSRGDDLRFLDWNIFARLERPMLRLHFEEEDVRIDLLIDASRSMEFGEPVTKLEYARRIAAAIGYLSISAFDRVGASAFANGPGPRLPAARGRSQLRSLLSFLERLEPPSDGGTDLAVALKRYASATTRPGILYVISDFLDGADFAPALKRLAARRFDVNLVQVLTPEEVDPPLGGDLVLVDSETGDAKEMTLNRAAAASYRRALDAHWSELEALAPTGIALARATTDISIDELFLRGLRSRGLIRGI